MQAPPPPSAPPPLIKHQTNCYPYHEMETINNSIDKCVVSELMFHNDDSDSSNIIENNNNSSSSNLLPLPRLMEVQENGTIYNNSCCFTTTNSSSQEISSLSSPSSYSLGTSTYAAASSNWSDNAVVIGEEVLGFLVEFGSKPPPPPPSSNLSSYSNNNNNYPLPNGFDYHEKLVIGTEDDQEIHIPSTSNSNLVNYSYSSTSTLLDNISENEPAVGLRHH